MSSSFRLEIIAADKIYYNGKAFSVILPTSTGQREILAHHSEMICAVSMGTLRFKKEDDSWDEILVGAGSVQAANNRVTVLVDSAETAEEIDQARAEEAKARAEERLRQQKSITEYKMTQAALARAMYRLKFKGRDLK